MTDNTQPEALIDLIDAYAETRHRYGRIHNAKTEAARNAVIEALSGVQALSAAPAIGDELRDTLVAVSAAIAERDDRAAQKMICEILAASTTPPAEQTFITPETGNSASAKGAAITSESGTPPAEQQAQSDECFPGEPKVAVPQGLIGAACCAIRNKRDGGKVLEQLRRYTVGDRSQPLTPQQEEAQEPAFVDVSLRTAIAKAVYQQVRVEFDYKLGSWMALDADEQQRIVDSIRGLYTTPQPAPTAQADSGFDYKTAADFLNGKTVSDEAVRKFVAASRWAHDERAALSATLLAMHGVLTSREAEIALLKQALLEAETATQPAPAPLSEMPYERRKAIQEGEQIGASDAWFKARHEMLDTLDRRNVFRAGFDRGWNAAIAAQGGKDATVG